MDLRAVVLNPVLTKRLLVDNVPALGRPMSAHLSRTIFDFIVNNL